MKELEAILSICSLHPENALTLATLVKASGSTYRRPGARMLILEDGGSVGSVSGGCLERDLIEKGQVAARKGESIMATYDTSAEELIRFIGNIFHRRHSIGAEDPEQIALSILAEIQAVIAGRPGGLLHEKKGPSHAPTH